jgi:hypothetical protein
VPKRGCKLHPNVVFSWITGKLKNPKIRIAAKRTTVGGSKFVTTTTIVLGNRIPI